MNYVPLNKIYYSEFQKHRATYLKRFNSSETKHFDILIREYNRQASYPSFFCYTEEFMRMSDQIHERHEILLSVLNCVSPLVIDQFVLSCLVEEIRATSDIEGVHSTRREIQDVVNGTSQSARFSSLVEKYQSLLSFKQIAFNTCEDIRRFYDEFAHKEIVRENPNHRLDGDIFRKDSVDITSPSGKTIHQGVIPEEKIIELLSKALEILNDSTIPLLVRVAIFHYFFEYIHPFYDGNGRTARFIVSYFLASRFHILIALRLSLVLKNHKKRYYELFKITDLERNCGDLTPFVLGFTEMILATFDDIISTLDRKIKQILKYKEKLFAIIGNDKLTRKIYTILLETSVFFAQGVSMDDLIDLTDKSRNTIKSRLDSFPEGHVIKSSTKKIYYRLNMMIFKNSLL